MLEREGYTPHGTIKQLHLFAHLSRWLEAERLAVADLDHASPWRGSSATVANGHTKLISLRAADPMLRYLRGLGFIADTTRPVLGDPVEELLARYQRYLVVERGLLPDSARSYAVNVRPFVEGLTGPSGIELDRLDGPAVVAFVVATCPRADALLGEAHSQGAALAAAVPARRETAR
jgi:integrase/recombinase XerD